MSASIEILVGQRMYRKVSLGAEGKTDQALAFGHEHRHPYLFMESG